MLKKWCSPNRSKGTPPFINAPKMVDFPSKRHVSDLEMIGFFLQHDLGIMENVLNGVNDLQHLEKCM
jgi:hypothetical protein